MPSLSETAMEIFGRSFNCAQSVFSVFAVQAGMDESTALKLASPFGGGAARRGELCGAVTGALLALGLQRGADQPAGKEAVYALAGEFLSRFEAAHGSLRCRDLIGYDLSTPAGHQAAADQRVFVTVCPLLVRDAAELAEALLQSA